MNNQIETVKLAEGVVTFDYATGIMRAKWNNGYNETWSHKGYPLQSAINGFYRFIEQEWRIVE
jgi:urocanate hydratase